jgi:hypothetical protein
LSHQILFHLLEMERSRQGMPFTDERFEMGAEAMTHG